MIRVKIGVKKRVKIQELEKVELYNKPFLL